MESIELSDNEKLWLFRETVHKMQTGNSVWKKGADFCLQYDIKHKKSTLHGGSEMMGFLHDTIHNNKSKMYGVDLDRMIEFMDRAIEAKVCTPKDKIFMFTEIVKSGALLYMEDINLLLSQSEVREAILKEYNEADPQRKEKDEKLNRAYVRLMMYERGQTVYGDGDKSRSVDDVKFKHDVRVACGKDIADHVFEDGISLSKKLRKEFPDDSEFSYLVQRIRSNAKKTNVDKLEKWQKDAEKKGFVRNILNRRKQNDD